MFKFKTYDVLELEKCGTEFVAALRSAFSLIPAEHTEAWTEFVLDWFAGTAATSVLVDARFPRGTPTKLVAQRQTKGEFLVDLVHSTYPLYPPRGKHEYWTAQYFDAALAHDCRVRLALESEWGRADSEAMTRVAVLQDAIKVAALRADAKVMVYGPLHRRQALSLLQDLKALRAKARDSSPWLCAWLPWNEDPPGFEVISEG